MLNWLLILIVGIPIVWGLVLYESVQGYGAVDKLVGLDIKLLMVLMLVGLWVKQNRKSRSLDFVLKINAKFWLPISLAIWIWLAYYKMSQGINFMLGKWTVDPQVWSLVGLYSIGLWVIKRSPMKVKAGFIKIVTVVIVGFALVSNVFHSSGLMLKKFAFVFDKNLQAKDERMRTVWEDFYDHMLWVEEVTEDTVSIVHPPQANPWQMVGNQLVVRYFLHPRMLRQADETNFPEKARVSDYVLISNGTPEWYMTDDVYGWPQQPVAYERIDLFYESKFEVTLNSVVAELASGQNENLQFSKQNIQTESSIIETELIPIAKNSLSPNRLVVSGYAKGEGMINIIARLTEDNGFVKTLEGNSIIFYGEEDDFEVTFDPKLLDGQAKGNSPKDWNYYIQISNKMPLLYLYDKGIVKVVQSKPEETILSALDGEMLGNYYYMIGDLESAERAYLRTLDFKSDSGEALLGLALIAMKEERDKVAVNYLSQLEKLLPDDPVRNLASYLLRSQFDEVELESK